MIVIKLYRYVRDSGGATISPNKPNCEYTELVRLVADEGKALTNDGGKTLCDCIDTDTVGAWGWQEVDAIEDSEQKTEETASEA